MVIFLFLAIKKNRGSSLYKNDYYNLKYQKSKENKKLYVSKWAIETAQSENSLYEDEVKELVKASLDLDKSIL